MSIDNDVIWINSLKVPIPSAKDIDQVVNFWINGVGDVHGSTFYIGLPGRDVACVAVIANIIATGVGSEIEDVIDVGILQQIG